MTECMLVCVYMHACVLLEFYYAVFSMKVKYSRLSLFRTSLDLIKMFQL